jgi:methionyl-tRNA synthetase
MKVIYSAWPYANGELHIGRITGSILPADIFNRFKKLFDKSKDIVYTFGSDMNGTPILYQALKDKIEPKNLAIYYHNKFIKALNNLSICPDLYTNTLTKFHSESVNTFLRSINHKLVNHRYGIYYKHIELLFCKTCEKFRNGRMVEYTCKFCKNKINQSTCKFCMIEMSKENINSAKCKICKSELDQFTKFQPLLNIKEYQNQIIQYIKLNNPEFLELTQKYFQSKSVDKQITRYLQYGIKTNLESDSVVYVWIQALLGYLSNLKLITQDLKVQDYYFIGIDNWLYHLIVLNSLKLSLGLGLTHKIFIRKYLNIKGQKMSSSSRNYITLQDISKKYPNLHLDGLRWYLCKIDPDTSDSNFSYQDLKQTYNKEFINNILNIQNRIYGYCKKYQNNLNNLSLEINYQIFPEINELYQKSKNKLVTYKILELTKRINQKLQKQDLKDIPDIIKQNLNMLIYIYPIAPNISSEIFKFYTNTDLHNKPNLVNFKISEFIKLKPIVLPKV